jgi:hypothetical protein
LPTRPSRRSDSEVSASATTSHEGRGPSSATTCLVGRPPEAARPAVTSCVCGNGRTARPVSGPRGPVTPVFKLCFRSSQPFVGVCDLGGSGAAARRRPPRSARVAVAAAVGRCPCGPSHVGKVTLVNVCQCHRVIAWRHQAGPSAPRPPVAGAGPAAGASARPGRGWRPRVRMVGGLGEKRVGLGLLLKTHPVRVHPRPRHPVPVCPPATAESDAELPKGPPGVARALAARPRAGPCVAELAGAPAGRVTDICSTGCAWFRRHTLRPRAFHPGPRGAALLGGLSPADPSSPALPISLGRAGPRLVP